jgi:cytochrome d ubiquinol oxidase subunit I
VWDFDPVLLSRIQFAFTISFHIIFPSFTIGPGGMAGATLEGVHLATRNRCIPSSVRLLAQVFAVSFGMGVVSGVAMAFQFGTNWSVLSQKMGSIQGPARLWRRWRRLLEATFLGVVLVGRDRVPRWFYFLACCMISLATAASSFWIMATTAGCRCRLGTRS